MERSIYKVANDFFIGKSIQFFIEARNIGGSHGISRMHESNRHNDDLIFEWKKRDTEYGGYEFRDEKIIDKIIKIEFKNRDWIFHTLEGYELKRSVFGDILIVDTP